jgi:hypothetical protein
LQKRYRGMRSARHAVGARRLRETGPSVRPTGTELPPATPGALGPVVGEDVTGPGYGGYTSVARPGPTRPRYTTETPEIILTSEVVRQGNPLSKANLARIAKAETSISSGTLRENRRGAGQTRRGPFGSTYNNGLPKTIHQPVQPPAAINPQGPRALRHPPSALGFEQRCVIANGTRCSEILETKS